MTTRSEALLKRACKTIPGGVNSPVRAGKSVDMYPPFIAEALGAVIRDVDGNEYIDYVGSWGPMILGHAHPTVVAALQERIGLGTSYGAPTELEVIMAEAIVEMVPSMEMVRMVNSGTEAAMSAIRLARGITGREMIVKFDGCYHGHADSLLVSAGSGIATLGIPGSPGVPDDLARHTLSLPFNDLQAVKGAFDRYGPDIACIIVEPVPGNMGVILPDMAFLRGLRELTKTAGSLLVFDEVITGFRVAPGGAQERYGMDPDLTCLGKIIGGGLPVGAYGGKREMMLRMAPEGDIYQAGTLSGNPLAMAAGIATLTLLRQGDLYQRLEHMGNLLFSGLASLAEREGVPVAVNHVGSMGSFFFTNARVSDFATAKASDAERFKQFYRSMRGQGIYLAPSAFEASFISAAHTEEMIEKTLNAASNAFKEMLH